MSAAEGAPLKLGGRSPQASDDDYVMKKSWTAAARRIMREEDGEDEGGAGPHASLREVKLTGIDSADGPSSEGADNVTSVPTGMASSVAAERLPRQTASMP